MGADIKSFFPIQEELFSFSAGGNCSLWQCLLLNVYSVCHWLCLHGLFLFVFILTDADCDYCVVPVAGCCIISAADCVYTELPIANSGWLCSQNLKLILFTLLSVLLLNMYITVRLSCFITNRHFRNFFLTKQVSFISEYSALYNVQRR